MSPGIKARNRPSCFVIMPFDPKFTRVYELVLAPACREAGFEPERADTSQASERITNHLLARLLESELVLGDLSSRNPNVLYELGVRHACGGSTVLVQRCGTERIFDIQDIRTTEYDGRLSAQSIKRDIEGIAGQIRSTWERARAENLVYRAAGSLGFAGRQEQGYKSFLHDLCDADGSVRILVTFAYFLNDRVLLEDVFRRLSSRGCEGRVLLLDPASAAAIQRGHDRPGKDVPAEIRSNLLSVTHSLASVNGSGTCECKIYDSFPPFALFQCGGNGTMIFYEYRKDLKETQSLTFSMGTPLGRYVSGVFEDLWKNADTSMPLDDYLCLRGWFGKYLHGVRYVRGRECDGPADCALWLLLSADQHAEVADYLSRGEPVDVDDVAPGRYTVKEYPVDAIRRVAVQKYGEPVVDRLSIALAARPAQKQSAGQVAKRRGV